MMNLSLQRGLSQRSELKRSGSIKLEDFVEEEGGGNRDGGEGREEEVRRREHFLRDYQGWRRNQLELIAFLLSYDLVETKKDELILKKIRIVGRRREEKEGRRQKEEIKREEEERKREEEGRKKEGKERRRDEKERRMEKIKEGYEENWIVVLSKKRREFYELKIMEFFKNSAITYFSLQPLLLYYYHYLIPTSSSPTSPSSSSSSFPINAFYSER